MSTITFFRNVVMFEEILMQITLLICIQEVPGSNLGRDADYPNRLFMVGSMYRLLIVLLPMKYVKLNMDGH
jgi:hypothetical protein